MANRYSILLKFLVNLNSLSNFEFECKIKFIKVTIANIRLGLKCGARPFRQLAISSNFKFVETIDVGQLT
jgi:hypothetical protein